MPLLPNSQRQWPRGGSNELHAAATLGSARHVEAALASGSIDIDQGDPKGFTPLMIAAASGDSRVASILQRRGANVSIVSDGGFTALHFSAQQGRLDVTKLLVKAGAVIDAVDDRGFTPLHMAADRGHWEIMSALIEGGANIDTRLPQGSTPLFSAAINGHTAAVTGLLRAGANPLLSKVIMPHETTDPSMVGSRCLPLVPAAQLGHTRMVRELLPYGYGGASGGLYALRMAAQQRHVDIMDLLTAAGVVDTGRALLDSFEWGREAAIKFLLQQQQLRNPAGVTGYVNYRGQRGSTPLFSAVSFARSSSRVVRLLIDAGADPSSAVEVKNSTGGLFFKGTPLGYTIGVLVLKYKVQGQDATEDQRNRLTAIRRLLLRVEAVHAASWLWPSDAPSVGHATGRGTTTAEMAPSTGASLRSMLPILRQRARRPRVLLAPLFRLVPT